MQLIKFLLMLAVFAVVSGPQSALAAGGLLPVVPGQGTSSGLQLAGHVDTHYDGRWFGRGSADACEQSWAMDISVRGGKVQGRFWRGGVLYDVYGEIDADGAMLAGRGGKNKREFGVIAPRFLRFDIYFFGETAEGIYAVTGSGGLYCQSPLELKRTEQ